MSVLTRAVVLAMLVSPFVVDAQPATSRAIILSTTTSTQDSGLLDVLVPMFERQTGYTVKAVSVGTGRRWPSPREARRTSRSSTPRSSRRGT